MRLYDEEWLAIAGLAAVVLLCVGLFFGLQAHEKKHHVSEGVITSMEFVPSHTTIMLMPVSNGKTTTLIPVPQHHADAWFVTINGIGRCGERHDRTIQVYESKYESLSIGQPLAVEE